MRQEPAMKRLGFVVAVTTVFSVGCTKDQPVQPPTTRGPAFLISDGTHSGGTPNFLFLHPVVPDPRGIPNFVVGTFIPNLPPLVEVCHLKDNPLLVPSTDCLLDGLGHAVLILGPATMALDLTTEQSPRNGDPKSPPLDAAMFYRITVRGAPRGKALGFLDVDPVDQGIKTLRTGDVAQFQDGRTLPIKVRIQEGAFGSRNPDHVEQVVPTHIPTPTRTLDVTTTTGFAGARFSDGWLPQGAVEAGIDQVVVTIERVPVHDATPASTCLQSGLLELEGCYRFRTDPDLHQFGPFRVNVIEGVCFELPIHTPAPFQLHRRAEERGTNTPGAAGAPTHAHPPLLSICPVALPPPV